MPAQHADEGQYTHRAALICSMLSIYLKMSCVYVPVWLSIGQHLYTITPNKVEETSGVGIQ